MFSLFSKRIERLFKWSNALKDLSFNKNMSCKKNKDNLTKHFVHKELRRSDSLIAIKEYIGARETPSSTEKRKNIKRNKNVKGNIKLKSCLHI